MMPTFFLAMAIADDALFGIHFSTIFGSRRFLWGENELILRYNESVLDQPILRKCTKADGVTDERIPKSAFLAIYEKTLKNAGYFCGTSHPRHNTTTGQKR
jgi:hypothetical protein